MIFGIFNNYTMYQNHFTKNKNSKTIFYDFWYFRKQLGWYNDIKETKNSKQFFYELWSFQQAINLVKWHWKTISSKFFLQFLFFFWKPIRLLKWHWCELENSSPSLWNCMFQEAACDKETYNYHFKFFDCRWYMWAELKFYKKSCRTWNHCTLFQTVDMQWCLTNRMK